jgi:hypothetical protein
MRVFSHDSHDENQQPQPNKRSHQTTTPGRSQPIKDFFDDGPLDEEVIKPLGSGHGQQIHQDQGEDTRMGAAQTLATLGTRPLNATPPTSYLHDAPTPTAVLSPQSRALPTAPTPVARARVPRQGRPRPNGPPRTPHGNDTSPWPTTSASQHTQAQGGYTVAPPGTVRHTIDTWVEGQATQRRSEHTQTPGRPTSDRYVITVLGEQQRVVTRPTHQPRNSQHVTRTPARNVYRQSNTNTPNAHLEYEGEMSGVEYEEPDLTEDDSPAVRQEWEDPMEVEQEQRQAVDPRTRTMMPPPSTVARSNRRMTIGSHSRPRPYPSHGPHATPGAAIRRGHGEAPATERIPASTSLQDLGEPPAAGPMTASVSLENLPSQARPTAYPRMADLGNGRPSKQMEIERQRVSADYEKKWGAPPSVLQPAPPTPLSQAPVFEDVQVGLDTLQTMRVRRYPNQTFPQPGPTGTMQANPFLRTPTAKGAGPIVIGLDGHAWQGVSLPRVHDPQVDIPATPGAVNGAAEALARATLAATPRGPPRPPMIPVPTPGDFGDAILGPAQEALRNIEANPYGVNFADPDHVSRHPFHNF